MAERKKLKRERSLIQPWTTNRLWDPDYIALDDGTFEFGWRNEDVWRFDELYKQRANFWEIVKELKRDPDEVLILLIDRARKGKIHAGTRIVPNLLRKHGIYYYE